MNDKQLDIEALKDVEVAVSVLLGSARATVAQVLAFVPGDVVTLDSRSDAPVFLLVNGVPIAFGDIVVADDGRLALEIASIVEPDSQAAPKRSAS